jgi:hypothetical protein
MRVEVRMTGPRRTHLQPARSMTIVLTGFIVAVAAGGQSMVCEEEGSNG